MAEAPAPQGPIRHALSIEVVPPEKWEVSAITENREEPEKAVEEYGPEDGIPYGQSVIVRSRSMFPHVPFRHLLRVPFSALVR